MGIIKLFKKIIDGCISIIYPNRCVGCNEILDFGDKWLCGNCRKDFVSEGHKRCKICGRIIYHNGNCRKCNSSKRYFDKGHSVFEYKGAVRNGVMNYKYKGLHSYGRYFGKIMANYALDYVNTDMDFDYVTAVPLHYKRFSDRGYNQSEIMAKYVAKAIGVEYKKLLKRKINTRPLNSLSGVDRGKEIKSAFTLRKRKNVKDKNILIIDDIYTTGATVNECCKELKKNGAAVTDFFTLSCLGED